MRKILSLIIVILSFTSINAQQEIGISGGYGSYLMSSLRFMQNEISQNSDLNLTKTTSFPPYFNYSFRYGSKVDEKSYFGAIFGLMSTGARSSLSDYSGFVYSDINLVGLRAGSYFKQKFFGTNFINKSMDFSYMIDISGIYTVGTFVDSLRIYDTPVKEGNKLKLNSIGLYTEPLLVIDFNLTSFLSLELMAGGALNVNLPFFYQKLSNKLEYNGRSIRPNWSGFRIGAGLIFRLE